MTNLTYSRFFVAKYLKFGFAEKRPNFANVGRARLDPCRCGPFADPGVQMIVRLAIAGAPPDRRVISSTQL
jgi:hypothetical protein